MFDSEILRCAVLVVTITMLAAGRERAPESREDALKMEFVRIPAGNFHMGSPLSEEGRESDEGPVHEVHITKPFYMGKYEVTQAQWRAVMGTTTNQQREMADSPWHLKGEGPEHPMYYVSWEEVVEFCNRLGPNFRLPTEAEWEYACRAGSKTRFCYGDDPNYSELGQYAWYYGNSDNKTHPVGQKKPNDWGLYDMHGNVDEWCSDQYLFPNNNDKIFDSAGKFLWRVFRGGNWVEKPKTCRSASRRILFESSRLDLIGFRVVYSGRDDGKEVLRMALPQKASAALSTSDKESDSRHQAIAGVVRDEAGLPIDDVEMKMLPIQDWLLRLYAKGRFEAYKLPRKSDSEEHYLLVRHIERNLVADVELDEDANTLDVKLEPGVILTGKVIDSEGME